MDHSSSKIPDRKINKSIVVVLAMLYLEEMYSADSVSLLKETGKKYYQMLSFEAKNRIFEEIKEIPL